MQRPVTVAVLCLASYFLHANPSEERLSFTKMGSFDSLLKKYYFIAEYQVLRSTHATFFKGADIMIGRKLSPKFSVGIGIEYAHTSFHDDNGWKLYNLKFVPVFIDARLSLGNPRRIISPFLQLSSGISIVNYSKEDQNSIGQPYRVSENGLYTYLGAGASFRVSKHFKPFVGIGFKGFHMSLNVYEVNPHGVTYRVGFIL